MGNSHMSTDSCTLLVGISMGNRQVDPATSSKFNEAFRVCTAFCADHFGNKSFSITPYFRKDTRQILLALFCIFEKNQCNI